MRGLRDATLLALLLAAALPAVADTPPPPQAAAKFTPPQAAGKFAPPQAAGKFAPPQAAGKFAPPQAAGNVTPPQAAGKAPPPEALRLVPGGRAGFVTDNAGGCWVWVGGIPFGAEALEARWSGPCPDGPAEGEGRSEIRWREAGQDRQMVFEGQLRQGKAEGPGRLTHSEAGRVTVVEQGSYRNDRFTGGRFEVPDRGLTYEGGWGGQGPEGQGRLTLPGQEFEGLWEAGCLRTERGWLSFTRPPEQCEGQAT